MAFETSTKRLQSILDSFQDIFLIEPSWWVLASGRDYKKKNLVGLVFGNFR